jgi:hypothetical protein
MKGYIRLPREIMNHWTWKDPRYFKWWCDLQMTANHKDNPLLMNGQLIKVRRGNMVTSLMKLSERWGVSREVVRNFLLKLEKTHDIKRKSNPNYTHISICNYDSYGDEFTTGNTAGTQRSHLNNNVKNVKNTPQLRIKAI